MAYIPDLDPQNRIREVQTSPSGAAFGAAQAGVAALARGVQDMGKAISAKGEQIRVTERQKTEMSYRSKAQEILDTAKRAEGSNAAGAAEKAREDLAKLKNDTLANSWGSSARELENSTSLSNLQSEAMLMSHVNQQQEVADKNAAQSYLEQSKVATNNAPVQGMVSVAANEALANLSAYKERYQARTGYALPKDQAVLVEKALVGELMFDGFIQKFAEDPVGAMAAWDRDKDKLAGMMDSKNYAALEAKTNEHRGQVAYIMEDQRIRESFTNDLGDFDAAAAAAYANNPQNWKLGQHLDATDMSRMTAGFMTEATMNRAKAATEREQQQQSMLKGVGELVSSGNIREAEAMLNTPDAKNLLTYSQIQSLGNLKKDGAWTGDDHNQMVYDIRAGRVTNIEGVMRRMNASSNFGAYASLLDDVNGSKATDSVNKDKPNYYSKIDAMITNKIQGATTDRGEINQLKSLYFGPIRDRVNILMDERGVTDVRSPEMYNVVRDAIGEFEKDLTNLSTIQKMWSKVPIVGSLFPPKGELAPTGLTGTSSAPTKTSGKPQPPTAEQNQTQLNNIISNPKTTNEEKAKEISITFGKDYEATLNALNNQGG